MKEVSAPKDSQHGGIQVEFAFDLYPQLAWSVIARPITAKPDDMTDLTFCSTSHYWRLTVYESAYGLL